MSAFASNLDGWGKDEKRLEEGADGSRRKQIHLYGNDMTRKVVELYSDA